MRRVLTGTLCVALLSAPAGAAGVADLDALRDRRADARDRAGSIRSRLDSLQDRYERLEHRADRASAFLIDAYRADLELRAELQTARAAMEERASLAYRTGPGVLLQAVMGVTSVHDLLAAREIIERTFMGDVDRLAALLDRGTESRGLGRRLERRRAALARHERRLSALREALAAELADAEAEARLAGRRIDSLERERDALEAAAARSARRRALSTGDTSLDALLALLGPDGGRGCDLHPRLRATGKTFSGVASWYGWDFAGNPTASGAIYDPRLFTAAHRTLPLNTFVRVRHGDRCAVVLVNDRGPYIDGRVLDLSMAAAEYLGVGLNTVDAEILGVTR